MMCGLKLFFFCQNHSQCNRTVCGGDDFYARDDCVAMGEDGEWAEVGTLVEFYLLSQEDIQATSRPGDYQVCCCC